MSNEKLMFVDIVLRDYLLQCFVFVLLASDAQACPLLQYACTIFGPVDDYSVESVRPIVKNSARQNEYKTPE